MKKIRFTQEQFVEKANLKHNFKYDYSKTEYIKSTEKVCVICSEHGEFFQEANGHLRGKGCPKCSYKKQSQSLFKSTETFIKDAKTIHGDKYDYSKVDYTGTTNKVILICREHGDFLMLPCSHLNQKSGCPKCKAVNNGNRLRLTNREFIQKAKKIHGDRYNYDKIK